MSAGAVYDLNGLIAAQVDAFADMIEQRDRARDCAVVLEQECAHLEAERDQALLDLAEVNSQLEQALATVRAAVTQVTT